jgi:hypothetical protein
MKKLLLLQIAIGVAAFLYVAGAAADPSSQKIKLTFSQAVRVPGVALPAGTYYFQSPRAAATNARTLVKITDESGKLMTQFMGIPERTQKKNHDVITFGAHDCNPTAIKLWFYPGNTTGVRFVYSKEEAASIASACKESVPEVHGGASDISQSQVYLMAPTGQEENYKPEALSASDQLSQNGFDGVK